MSSQNQTVVSLTGVGGAAPYTFAVVNGPLTNITATISGSVLTVDATNSIPGTYSVDVLVTDQKNATGSQTILIEVLNPSTFAVLNRDIAFEPNSFPYSTTVPLTSVGGNGAVTWQLISSATTLPSVTLTGSTLSFTMNTFGEWTVAVRATDSLNNTAIRVITVSVPASDAVALIDGHVLLQVSPLDADYGQHQFSLTVTDSAAATASETFSYQINEAIAPLNLPNTSIDHFWANSDSTAEVYPIAGSLSGYSIASSGSVVSGNGITISIDPTTNTLTAVGPPSTPGNFQVQVPITVDQSGSAIATITKDYTIISHQNVYQPTFTVNPNTAWQSIALKYTASATGVVRITLQAGAAVDGPTIFWDDITVTPVVNILNQGFENGTLSPWNTLGTGTQTVVTTAPHGGLYCLSMTPGLSSSVGVYQDISGLTPGTIYTITAWVRSQAVTASVCYLQALDPTMTVPSEDFGSMVCYTKTYIIGELVGLNPERPNFNSPKIYKTPGYTLQQSGNSTINTLPMGLSLDSKTGLIYGNILDNDVALTYLQYFDSNGIYQDDIKIVWDIVNSQFQLIDGLTDAEIQSPYTGNITASSSALLTSVRLYSGVLPSGLTLGLSSDGTKIVVSGTPVSAGHYDMWIEATNSNGQVAYLYKRFAVYYTNPLIIITDVLNNLITGSPFSQVLSAFGGSAPYTWSVVGTLPLGITLSSSGTLSGTPTQLVYSQNLVLTVTDIRGVTATTTLAFAINNVLTITTATLPNVTAGSIYSYQMQAEGGTAPYTWIISSSSPALPGGISMSSSGLIFGATALSSYSQNVIVQVTDAAANSVTKAYGLTLGSISGLYVYTGSISPVYKGQAYLATLTAEGPSVPPYTWAVSPNSPNALPAGLTLTTTASNNGTTASISGVTNQNFLNYVVEVQVTDANGNVGYGFPSLSSVSNLTITTSYLPQATVSGTYSTQLAASGSATPFTWSLDSTSGPLPTGLNLNSAGLLYGTPSTVFNVNLVFRVTDALGDYDTKALNLLSHSSSLAIITTGLAPYQSGVYGTNTLTAQGGTAPYTWSISPLSASTLPAGLTLYPSTGVVSGTSTAVGFDATVKFRVTDSLGVYVDLGLVVLVYTNLAIVAGPDFINGTNTGFLGIAKSGDNQSTIYPRTNYSFYAVIKNVVSTTQAGLSFGLPSGYSASIVSFVNNRAFVALTGPFSAPAPGTYPFNMTVNDSGTIVAATLQWATYSTPALSRVVQENNSPLPIYAGAYYLPLLEKFTGWVDITNNPSAEYWLLPTVPGETISPAIANAALFSFSGDNSIANSAMDIEADLSTIHPANYVYRFNYFGAQPPPNYAATNVTIQNQDMAWFSSTTSAVDAYGVTSAGGGASIALNVKWLISPAVSSVSPTTVEGNGATYAIQVTLDRPLPPIQAATITASFSATNGVSISSVTPNLSGGFLTSWTLHVTVPTVGSLTTSALHLTATDNLTYLSGSAIVTQLHYYFNNVNIASLTLSGPTRTAETGGYPGGNLATDNNGAFAGDFNIQGVTCDYFTQLANTPATSVQDYTHIIYPISSTGLDMQGANPVSMYLGINSVNVNANYGVGVGLQDANGTIWYASGAVLININKTAGIYGSTISTPVIPTGPYTDPSLTFGAVFYPNKVTGIVFFFNQSPHLNGFYVGAPSSNFQYFAEIY